MYNVLSRKAIVLAMPILFIGTCIVSGMGGNIQKNIGEDIDTKIINGIILTNGKIVSSSRDVDWWSMFRHDPEHIGYSTSKAPDTENILWSYTTSLDLKSSPAVADGKVYVGSDDYNIYCLDAGNGAKLWDYKTGNEVHSSPAVADGKVYVGSRDNCIYCLDMNNGNEIWRYETVYNVRSSPAVADGKVYVGSDDYNIYCLDAGNGAKLWDYKTGASVRSSPAVADGKVYVGSRDNCIYCLDAGNGAKLWDYETGASVYSSPAVADGNVYIGSWDDKIYCFGSENKPPNANFTYNPLSPSSLEVVQFNDTSIDVDGYVESWHWDFGDGNTSSDQNSTHQYGDNGTYSVTFRITDNGGETDEVLKYVTVINIPPNANFIFSPDNPSTHDLIQFSDISFDPDGTIVSWHWDFGDGDDTTEQNPSCQYIDNGTYTVKLEVADDDGATNFTEHNIIIGNEAPNAVNDSASTAKNTPVVIDVLANDHDTDGTINHTTVAIIGGPSNGGVSVDSVTGNVTYTPDLEYYGSDSFTYTVDDDEGATSNVATVDITINDVNDPPVAKFSYSPGNPTAVDTIRFTDKSSDSDGAIVSWHWDFGDGSGTSTDQNPTYSYNDNGTYDVTLSVTDNDGLIDTDTKKITIGGEGSTPVTVEITFPTQNGIVEGIVTVIGTAIADDTVQKVEVKIDSGSWILANGTESWSYKWDTTSVSNGDHTIHARSYDGNDYSNIDSVDSTVDNPTSHANQAPIVTISYPGNMYTVYGTITFAGTASDNDGTIQNVQIRIDFGSWILANGTESWSYKWDTTDFFNGSYIIDVRSYDGEDYSPIAEITVTVRNIQGAGNGEYSGGDGEKYADTDGPSDSTLILFIILVAIISIMGIVPIIYIIRIKTPT